jgi:hypothetical protein
MKVVDLAIEMHVDPTLLFRFIRHSAAMGYLTGVDWNEYEFTTLSKVLSLSSIGEKDPSKRI